MRLREQIISIFKSLHNKSASRAVVIEQLSRALSSSLNTPVTLQEVAACLDPLNPTIDHFLKLLIGRAGMVELSRGVEIGQVIKEEFPHFFTEHASYKKTGTC